MPQITPVIWRRAGFSLGALAKKVSRSVPFLISAARLFGVWPVSQRMIWSTYDFLRTFFKSF
jgi:hypothetical protein